jgi:hypothetical protein
MSLRPTAAALARELDGSNSNAPRLTFDMVVDRPAAIMKASGAGRRRWQK